MRSDYLRRFDGSGQSAFVPHYWKNSLVTWAVANFGLLVASLFFPSSAISLAGLLISLLQVSSVLWLIFVLITLKPRVEITCAVVFLLLMQMWSCVCLIHADRASVLGEATTTDYAFFSYVLAYLQGQILCAIEPGGRRALVSVFLAAMVLDGAMAIAEWLHFGWAVAIMHRYVARSLITDIGSGGVRPVGLALYPSMLALLTLVACALIVSLLSVRKLKWFEVLLLFFYGFVILISQVRNYYVGYAIMLAAFTIGMILRDRKTLAIALATVAVGGIGLFPKLQEKLQYGLYQTQGSRVSVKFRQEVSWAQGRKIYRFEPYFGIGPTAALTSSTSIVKSKYLKHYSMDNGYYLCLSYFGLPGLVIMILILVSAAAGAVWTTLDRAANSGARRFAAFGGLMALVFGWGMLFNNMFQNVNICWVIFCLAGLHGREASQLTDLIRFKSRKGMALAASPFSSGIELNS